MSFIFNECMHFFGVMNIAVVENEYASRTWVRIGKGDLHAALDITRYENVYTYY